MPALTRWFIKSALAYFVAALLLGVAVALSAVLPVPPAVVTLGPVYFHFFMVGWVAQLIFGVVYWMFPRYSKQKPRGSEILGWATYGFLNLGLLLRAVGEPLHALQPAVGWGWLLALSAVLQWLQAWRSCSTHGPGSRRSEMPRLSCWFIRASLLYLAVGFTLGALLLAHKGLPLHPALWRLLAPHIEFVLLGWTLQLAMGMAFWILPRYLQGPERVHQVTVWLAFALLNGGVLMVGIGWMLEAPALIPLIGRIAEAGSAIAFAVHAWQRVRPFGA